MPAGDWMDGLRGETMYRLMLVEDEKLVRDSMIENTEWEALGYELVCACSDGREAIERLKAFLREKTMV